MVAGYVDVYLSPLLFLAISELLLPHEAVERFVIRPRNDFLCPMSTRRLLLLIEVEHVCRVNVLSRLPCFFSFRDYPSTTGRGSTAYYTEDTESGMRPRPQPYHVLLGLLRKGWLREGWFCGGPRLYQHRTDPSRRRRYTLVIEEVLCSPMTLLRFLFRFPLNRPAFFWTAVGGWGIPRARQWKGDKCGSHSIRS